MKTKLYVISRNFAGLIAGVLAFLLALALRAQPDFTDSIFREKLFTLYREVNDSVLSFCPIPLVYLQLLFLIPIWGISFYRSKAAGRTRLSFFLNSIGLMILWFYISWGYNYSATNFTTKQKVELEHVHLDEEYVLSEALSRAASLRALCDTASFLAETKSFESAIHSSVREQLRVHGFKTPGNVRMREIPLNGLMRRIGISGIYLPFSGEAHVDKSYLPLRKWFIMAHEYAHGYGISSEAECDFIAFLALRHSHIPELEYAAWFELADCVRPSRGDSIKFNSLPKFFTSELAALFADAQRFTPFLGETSNISNDLYLRINGIQDGVSSYNQLPLYYVAFQKATK
ncbi:MAG: hypothetical protein RL226_135 [Bacteroidota bacterium]